MQPALWGLGGWLAAHTLSQSGHCVPKSGSHALQRMAPLCSSLVWSHPSCKAHAGMPHHLDFCQNVMSPTAENVFHKKGRDSPKIQNRALGAANWPIKK